MYHRLWFIVSDMDTKNQLHRCWWRMYLWAFSSLEKVGNLMLYMNHIIWYTVYIIYCYILIIYCILKRKYHLLTTSPTIFTALSVFSLIVSVMLRAGCCPPCSGSIKSAWSLSKSSSNAEYTLVIGITSLYFE